MAVSLNTHILPTLAFVLTSKSEGRKDEERKNLNKESFQKSSWQKINRSNLKAAQHTPPDGPAHRLHCEIAGPGIYITWPVRQKRQGGPPQRDQEHSGGSTRRPRWSSSQSHLGLGVHIRSHPPTTDLHVSHLGIAKRKDPALGIRRIPPGQTAGPECHRCLSYWPVSRQPLETPCSPLRAPSGSPGNGSLLFLPKDPSSNPELLVAWLPTLVCLRRTLGPCTSGEHAHCALLICIFPTSWPTLSLFFLTFPVFTKGTPLLF